MSKKTILILIVIFLVIVGYMQYSKDGELDTSGTPGIDPLNTTYFIEGKPVTLVSGMAETELAPGSASRQVTKVFGSPIPSDLNEDFIDDALLILSVDNGGSGTFYYVAAALGTDGGYVGTNAILLGDRVAPQTIGIENGIAIANYAVRKEGEPMTASPSIGVTEYMTIRDGTLSPIDPLEIGESVMHGYITFGHEVRTFRPCQDGSPEYWLMGDSPALQTIKTTYEDKTSDVPPSRYAPLFAVVSGKIVPAPEDGFGSEYENGLRVSELVRSGRDESCKNDLIFVESPLAGTTIMSPLVVRGYARGFWFFEASFPLTLVDWDGKIIAQSHAEAVLDPNDPESTWMTEHFVPFEGKIEFEKPDDIGTFSNRGAIIFHKDNPSGLPEHDDALEMPVYFW